MRKLFAILTLTLFATFILPSCAENDLEEMEITEQSSPTDPGNVKCPEGCD